MYYKDLTVSELYEKYYRELDRDDPNKNILEMCQDFICLAHEKERKESMVLENEMEKSNGA